MVLCCPVEHLTDDERPVEHLTDDERAAEHLTDDERASEAKLSSISVVTV